MHRTMQGVVGEHEHKRLHINRARSVSGRVLLVRNQSVETADHTPEGFDWLCCSTLRSYQGSVAKSDKA